MEKDGKREKAVKHNGENQWEESALPIDVMSLLG